MTRLNAHRVYDDEDPTRCIATVHSASTAAINRVILAKVDNPNGRSQFVWVTLPNGDKLLGVYPQGDTYLRCEKEFHYPENADKPAPYDTSRISDKALRKFVQALIAEGFDNVQPDPEYGFTFTPMSGSLAGLERAMRACKWEKQGDDLFPGEDLSDKEWVYYVTTKRRSLTAPLVGIVPEIGMIHVS